jgi:hypothetical protein
MGDHIQCLHSIVCTLFFSFRCMCRVGQNHIYTGYIWCFWQGNHQIYGHIRCIYTVLANPMHVCMCLGAHSLLNAEIGTTTCKFGSRVRLTVIVHRI